MTVAFDYPDLAATGDALIKAAGQPVAIRHINSTGTAWAPTQTTTDYATFAAIVPLPRWYPSFIGGTTGGGGTDASDVRRTDRRGLISVGPLAAVGFVPTPNDMLVDSTGKIWRIMDMKSIAPSGLDLLYDTWLRQ